MKRITSIIIIAALIAALTGCNKTENPDSSNDSTSTSIQTNAAESTESAESTDSADSEPLSDDVKRLIEEYPCVLDFKGRDGMILPLSDITNIKFPSAEYIAANYLVTDVTYGLAYMSYGLPFFETTLDNDDWKSEGDGFSNAIDWLVYRRDKAEESSAGRDFEVKPGDKLENGLVVKSAETVYEAFLPESWDEINNDPYANFDPLLKTKIEFDGTLTLEGILFKYARDEDYFAAPNDVFFYPDTTKNEFVPMWHYGTLPNTSLLDPDVAVIYSDQYYLGNLDGYGELQSADYDVDEILGDRNYARVKITLKDICVGSVDLSTQSPQRAKIADIELID